MRLRFLLAFFFVQVLTIKEALGNDHNKTKLFNNNLKKHSLKDKYINEHRNKRSLDDNEKPFWSYKGKRLSIPEKIMRLKNDEGDLKPPNNYVVDDEAPFWGTRGRRDSTSIENDFDDGSLHSDDTRFSNCDHCYKFPIKNLHGSNGNPKESREMQDIPSWDNRGRSSEENDNSNYPFWESRGRRQDEDPFWGARGRREDGVPFWGNRGRRYSWQKHDDVVEEPPFWGNRGKRDEIGPFWGSRGRRQEQEPFWGSRGRRESKNTRKEGLKKVLHDAINTVEDNIESLTRTRRDGSYVSNSFWGTRGRDSKLSNLFKLGRHRFQIQSFLDDSTPAGSNKLHDNRIYAEQPHYILVERSSRSSGEDDPYYISRGKKMFVNYESPYSTRARRGSIEELVKSVRNDPYYIARGKKFAPNNSIENSRLSAKELGKAKELICATIDLLLFSKGNKTKREVDDNDRDRRTILKKLAAQLQIDPYFVSRGKKNESFYNEDSLDDFINEVSVKCNRSK